MSTRVTHVDKQQFGPWVVVTGASSGIGRAFATQLAANGINLVPAPDDCPSWTRSAAISPTTIASSTGRHRVDLAEPDFLIDATNDLDLGLVASIADDMNLGEGNSSPPTRRASRRAGDRESWHPQARGPDASSSTAAHR